MRTYQENLDFLRILAKASPPKPDFSRARFARPERCAYPGQPGNPTTSVYPGLPENVDFLRISARKHPPQIFSSSVYATDYPVRGLTEHSIKL